MWLRVDEIRGVRVWRRKTKRKKKQKKKEKKETCMWMKKNKIMGKIK